MEAPDITAQQLKNNLRITIENVMKSWRKTWPWEVTEFLEDLNQTTVNLVNDNGMSRDKTIMVGAAVPQRVDAAMMIIFGEDWMEDPAVARTFYEVCSNFKIRKGFEPWRSSKNNRPTIQDGYQIRPDSFDEGLLRAMQECRKSPRP